LYKKKTGWESDFKFRFTEKTITSAQQYEQSCDVVFPFAKYWNASYEERVNVLWDDFEITENEEQFFAGLVVVALEYAKDIFANYQRPLSIVCGAISTGPGTVAEKLILFKKAIFLLETNPRRQSLILNQMPLEDVFARYYYWAKKCGLDDSKILTLFYCPILKSGLINKMYFLPNYTFSRGARYEHFIGSILGIQRVYLAEDKKFLKSLENFWETFQIRFAEL
jgi:hypothetical protein